MTNSLLTVPPFPGAGNLFKGQAPNGPPSSLKVPYGGGAASNYQHAVADAVQYDPPAKPDKINGGTNSKQSKFDETANFGRFYNTSPAVHDFFSNVC